jgi:hypothetical protein
VPNLLGEDGHGTDIELSALIETGQLDDEAFSRGVPWSPHLSPYVALGGRTSSRPFNQTLPLDTATVVESFVFDVSFSGFDAGSGLPRRRATTSLATQQYGYPRPSTRRSEATKRSNGIEFIKS